jgi:serine/threonine-protein kinase
LIADRYRRVELIATGGMGEVWRGVDEVLGRPVAVKVLRSEYANDPDFRDRFRAEARAAAAVGAPAVVAVYDYGEQDSDDGCLAYLVMEYVEGESLADRLRREGVLSASDVIDLLTQTGRGLAAAHQRGLVHRDIKPANLLCADDGSVKIADFGIARAADGVSLTRTGVIVGTAHYISPEQAAGRTATAASDLYSLGAVAYACLVGKPPFNEGSDVTVAMAHLHDPVPSLPRTVPSGLRDMVLRMLAKDPAERVSSTDELLSELATLRLDPRAGDELATGPAADAPTLPVIAPAQVTEPTKVLPAGEPPAAGRRPADWSRLLGRRNLTMLVSGAIVLAILVGVAAASSGGPLGSAASASVPNLVGRSVGTARPALRADGFAVAIQPVNAPAASAGKVVGQSIPAGRSVARGTTVTLRVATGKVRVALRAFVGDQAAAAQTALAALGLRTLVVRTVSTAPTGTVVGLAPHGLVAIGDTVVLDVAGATPPPVVKGPKPKPAPPGHRKGGPHGDQQGPGQDG